MANMSSIYQFLDAEPDKIPLLWLAAPLTGLIVQPIIGYISDRTWHPFWGRRRPYFLIGAVLSSAALVLMPNCSELWMAAGLLWILDSSINISMEPFRAFVADKLPEEQRDLGFSMQSMFIGAGSVIASALPWILTNWVGITADSNHQGAIPYNVKLSFYIGAAAFFVLVLYTIITSKEYPPSEVPDRTKVTESKKGFGAGALEILHAITHMPKRMKQLALVQFLTWPGLFLMWFFYSPSVGKVIFHGSPSAQEIIHPQVSVTYLPPNLDTTLSEEELKDTATAQWLKPSSDTLAMLSLNWVKDTLADRYIVKYTTDTTTIGIDGAQKKVSYIAYDSIENAFNAYHRKTPKSNIPNAMQWVVISDRSSAKSKFSKGGEFAGLTFSFQNLITFLFALILPWLARTFTNRITHLICLAIGGISLLSFGWVVEQQNANFLFFLMAGVGIAWSSIVSMPYSMLSGIIPENKIGIYMGIFNFFIVLPEIIASLFFGKVMKYVLNNNEVHAVMIGGGLLLLAALLCLRIDKQVNNS
jgi:maltose/moltooligosaccharide transporter